MTRKDDMEKDLVEIIERFNALDHDRDMNYKLDKAWEEISFHIERLGFKDLGGPWHDPLEAIRP